MTIVWTVVTVLLLISAVLTTARILMGPSSLDRVVALDVLVALCMCGLAAWAAYSGDSTVIPAIVALSLLSFIGSISIARFRVRDDRS
ncbi:cation:proton antiporter [Gordonia pseudamarae]|jgi:multicomponent Na+:H+ antiporter subunit F|uniref:Cation:proton antiporter n=1 Tax=Gordonia pseudamarae TaxID=2831662 RepID=A0ABX6ID94_9ACTN|nr:MULTISPECIES: monovalent cation/H+ antiporter complex subunit F [Gordonia]MBD0022061.1 cation:proton antiporter [Gordonia sp. (in: high G+C Gram-positive bacteria)]QHN24916.1 cation:proton antiporter [Gordonia pseudamarae]QHN33849.1 cation:proton antiporter [Gordonia pseudamarae]